MSKLGNGGISMGTPPHPFAMKIVMAEAEFDFSHCLAFAEDAVAGWNTSNSWLRSHLSALMDFSNEVLF